MSLHAVNEGQESRPGRSNVDSKLYLLGAQANTEGSTASECLGAPVLQTSDYRLICRQVKGMLGIPVVCTLSLTYLQAFVGLFPPATAQYPLYPDTR